jgi:hypothetical protein
MTLYNLTSLTLPVLPTRPLVVTSHVSGGVESLVVGHEAGHVTGHYIDADADACVCVWCRV